MICTQLQMDRFVKSLSDIFALLSGLRFVHSKFVERTLMVIWLSSFQAGNTKLERFSPKNQQTKKKSMNFRIDVMGRCQKIIRILNLSHFFS